MIFFTFIFILYYINEGKTIRAIVTEETFLTNRQNLLINCRNHTGSGARLRTQNGGNGNKR
jgi:hypothetical protein